MGWNRRKKELNIWIFRNYFLDQERVWSFKPLVYFRAKTCLGVVISSWSIIIDIIAVYFSELTQISLTNKKDWESCNQNLLQSQMYFSSITKRLQHIIVKTMLLLHLPVKRNDLNSWVAGLAGNTALVSTASHLDVSGITPASSPGVLDDPVGTIVGISTVSDGQNSVVDGLGAARVDVHTYRRNIHVTDSSNSCLVKSLYQSCRTGILEWKRRGRQILGRRIRQRSTGRSHHYVWC